MRGSPVRGIGIGAQMMQRSCHGRVRTAPAADTLAFAGGVRWTVPIAAASSGEGSAMPVRGARGRLIGDLVARATGCCLGGREWASRI